MWALEATNGSIFAKPRRVVDVAFNPVAICSLVNDGVFPEQARGAGEVEPPAEDRLVSTVGQKCSDASKESRKLQMSAIHFATYLQGAVWGWAIRLCAELGSLKLYV